MEACMVSEQGKSLLSASDAFSQPVLCEVYVRLKYDEEALWLASRHNTKGHFNHRMSHHNYVFILNFC